MHRVFVLEDEKDILQLIQILLQQINCEIKGQSSTNNVINNILDYDPDLIVIDYWLENATADSVVKALKEHPVLRSVPVILISAATNLEGIAQELSVDSYLKKPFDINSFQNVIKSFL